MTHHTTEQILGLVPVAAAAGIATRSIKGIRGTKRTPLAIGRKHRQKLPPGKWIQISREEIVHLIGKAKADKVKAAGAIVKYGYDKFVYLNGRYYLS